ncbi:MAG: hypothetical protein IPM99_05305 [Rubrivivax sp.]|nr:hypothetical protein [Rubrivivax sp.]
MATVTDDVGDDGFVDVEMPRALRVATRAAAAGRGSRVHPRPRRITRFRSDAG